MTRHAIMESATSCCSRTSPRLPVMKSREAHREPSRIRDDESMRPCQVTKRLNQFRSCTLRPRSTSAQLLESQAHLWWR